MIALRLHPLLASVLLLAAAHVRAADVHTEFDVRPAPVRTPPPQYPAELKAKGLAGIVLLTLIVDEQGTVENLEVVRATDDAFIPATTAAVKQWKFKPAEKGGQAVKARFQIPVKFSVDN